ncbi:GM13183 [Drosophila sechellia]|uniref:GM13183 n=1 Tax=Drosophila sechellia TaxID=7238 RepID=B4INB7_DROSE|nr:GM13183 [Drosophila sechellia]
MEKSESRSNLADNLLYILQLEVDDLLIIRPNLCAPKHYPPCTKSTFRSAFQNIRDR